MASIQILELPPVEAQIEELSDDMTGFILGGVEINVSGFLQCVGEYIRNLDQLGPVDASARLLDCLALVINA